MRLGARLFCVVLLAFALASDAAEASCVYAGPYRHLLRIRISACETIPDYAIRATADVKFRWVREMAKQAAARPQGVVITGTLIERTALVDSPEGELVIDSRLEVSEQGTWYLESPVTDCSMFDGELEITFYSHAECCDVTPSYRIGCFFEIPTIQPVPENLSGLLKP